jgi:hypothetical protein
MKIHLTYQITTQQDKHHHPNQPIPCRHRFTLRFFGLASTNLKKPLLTNASTTFGPNVLK